MKYGRAACGEETGFRADLAHEGVVDIRVGRPSCGRPFDAAFYDQRMGGHRTPPGVDTTCGSSRSGPELESEGLSSSAPRYSFDVFLERATVGLVPGWIVFLSGVIFNFAVVIFAVATVRLREATGEVLPRHQFSLRSFRRVTDWTRSAAATGTQRAASRRAKRARQRTRTATANFANWTSPKYQTKRRSKRDDYQVVISNHQSVVS